MKTLMRDPSLEFLIQQGWVGLRICISMKFPGDAAVAGRDHTWRTLAPRNATRRASECSS